MDAPEDPTPKTAHDPYAALRLVDYRRFLIAGIFASAGAEMQVVAVGWELYERTRSATALGLVGLAMVLPVILLALPAGHAADRHSRKGMILLSQGLMAIASMVLAALSYWRGPVPLIYAALVVAGIAHAVSMPARWSILRQLVPDHLVGGAVTWNSSGWQVASVVGPSLAGLFIAQSGGATEVYLFDLALSIGVLALITTIRPRQIERLEGPASFGSMLGGLRFVRQSKLILATITLDLFAVLLGGAVALLPIFAKDILQVGPVGLGWLRAAPSIGAAMMALTLAHRPPLPRAGPALLWAVAGFGAATIAFGISRNPYLSFLLLMMTGALDNISVVVRSTLVQSLTPESMRGRVAAVNSIFIGCSNELGGFESGMTAHFFGPIRSVVGGGIGTILIVILVRLVWPDLARLGSLRDLAMQKIPEPTYMTSESYRQNAKLGQEV
ncbi:MFS transporter [Tundrisphaera lichenicola]|uniref:MFS transporter n=1 Tax=Tundrisphaera lichenicola TaxID=2029860 RepID=UPI003EC023B9